MLDIIILAILAFFVFKKLKSILGEEYDNDYFGYDAKQQKFVSKKRMKDADKVEAKAEIESGEFNYLDENSKQYAKEICDKIGNFSLSKFKFIVEKVFDAVIKANENQNKKEINTFFAPEIAETIIASFEGETQNHLVLVAIDKIEILSIEKEGNTYKINVKFASQQINYTTDKENKIIDGSKTEIVKVVEKWTFVRNILSKNQTWFIEKIEEV